MKWFFSIIIIIFFAKPLFSGDLEVEYQIKNKGIKIGSLTWQLNINSDTYKTTIDLKSGGFFSFLYGFEGKYTATGEIKNDLLFSKKYDQFWKTKNKEKIVKLTYKNKKIENLILFPIEKEKPRIRYKDLESYNDPITSFLKHPYKPRTLLYSGWKKSLFVQTNKKKEKHKNFNRKLYKYMGRSQKK